MHSRGFTFVEMMVVMTISAILIAVGVPSFQWTIARNRVSDGTNQLLSHLEYARMEASRRGNTVSLCRTLDANLVVPVCSNVATAAADGNDWAVGWIVYEKIPPVFTPLFQAGDQVIFRQAAMGGMVGPGTRVMIHSDSPGALLEYQPRGAGGIVGGGQMFAIDYGPVLTPISANRAITTIALTHAARCIPITPLGSMRVARTLAGGCQ
jgi:prepilin-type N-terminal cleavage/methylation domain-containing protein